MLGCGIDADCRVCCISTFLGMAVWVRTGCLGLALDMDMDTDMDIDILDGNWKIENQEAEKGLCG